MFAALGRFAVRRRWWVVAGALVFGVFAGIWGTGAFGALAGGAGFDDPTSASTRADRLLDGPLGRSAPDVVVLYENTHRTVDDPRFADPLRTRLARLPRTDLTRVESYWTHSSPDFVSSDRHATYVALHLAGRTDQDRVAAYERVRPTLTVPGLTVRFGGVTAMTQQVNAQVGRDIGLAEAVSLPLLILLMVLVFRSAVAASLPLALGGVVALGSFVVLRLVTTVAPVSTFAINVITMLGLGLAIDYGLLLVSRFREELAAGYDVDEAVERTVATAGRTVAFSGLIVALSLASLLVFPSQILRSMGYASAAVVVFAVLGSLTLLPALLRLLGRRVNALRVPLPSLRPASPGRWYRVAKAAMRRPLLTTVALVAVLLALGLPALGTNWARPGEWVLPSGADARAVTQQLDTRFAANPTKVVTVVVEGDTDTAHLTAYAERLGAVPGVSAARVSGRHADLARLTLSYRMDPQSRSAATMVRAIRAVPSPPGTGSLATGMPASRVDIVAMIGANLPWMGLAVLLISFVVLFLAFRSVVLPLKAAVLNLLSLAAAFGAIKLIFQDGHLSGLLGFVPIGAVDANFPVLVAAIAFGLSVDYEVFLLSRIREHRLAGHDLTESIAVGTQRTAGIITSAALLFVFVGIGFVTSQITFMKMIGVGLVIAVVVDATVVRGLLVPASMRLLGRAAWWAPAPLSRLFRRRTPEPVAAVD
ncbi:MAG TPA: MMPL family transporter [Actinocatenispora sp.]